MTNMIKIPAATGPSQQIAMMNSNFQRLANESVTKLYNDSSGIPNISIGVQPDGTSRIRIAKAGVNVTTATDDQLAFNSAQNVFKVVKSGTATVTPPATWNKGDTATVTVPLPAGLGFQPGLITFVKAPVLGLGYIGEGVLAAAPSFILGTVGASLGQIYIYATSRIDSLNVYFDLTYFGSAVAGYDAYSWQFKYYLLQESAS